MNAPEIRTMPVADLAPAKYNPRKISDEAIAGLTASVKRFGIVQPIVWNKRTKTVVGGHQRLRVLRDTGVKKVPVVVVDLPATEERALNLTLNNPHVAGEWTEDLGDLLAGLKIELPDMYGDLLLGDLMGDVPRGAVEIVEDEVPEPPKNPVTKAGDLWTLGRHRLLCGNAGDLGAVARAAPEGDVVMVTDPPYCSGGSQEAQKKAGTWGDIAADNLSTRSYQALIGSVFSARPLRAVYVFTDWRMWTTLFDIVEAKGHAVRSMLVWAKESPAMGGIWRTQHELILFASRENQAKRDGEGSMGNVLRAARSGNANHYTEKPVVLIADIIRNDGTARDREHAPVYDPFLGSGTTLIAAEQLDRSCYALEIEPAYCDVVVERWQNLTGEKARRDV